MAQVGRDPVRSGDSMHLITMSQMGRVSLLPCSSWHWEGDADPETWTLRATVYGPSTSTTRHLPRTAVIFVKWGSAPGQRYVGTGPLSWASTTARLQSETERILADEASGPLAQLLAISQDGGDDDEEDERKDPLRMLKLDIARARGQALLLETTAAGWGTGMSSAPRRDWASERLGPNPPAAMGEINQQIYAEVLAACGCSVAMFDDSDGTSKREAERIWLHSTVRPLGKLLASELSERLETPVDLNFDQLYMHDLSGRAASFMKLVSGGMTLERAAALSGLMGAGE